MTSVPADKNVYGIASTKTWFHKFLHTVCTHCNWEGNGCAHFSPHFPFGRDNVRRALGRQQQLDVSWFYVLKCRILNSYGSIFPFFLWLEYYYGCAVCVWISLCEWNGSGSEISALFVIFYYYVLFFDYCHLTEAPAMWERAWNEIRHRVVEIIKCSFVQRILRGPRLCIESRGEWCVSGQIGNWANGRIILLLLLFAGIPTICYCTVYGGRDPSSLGAIENSWRHAQTRAPSAKTTIFSFTFLFAKYAVHFANIWLFELFIWRPLLFWRTQLWRCFGLWFWLVKFLCIVYHWWSLNFDRLSKLIS